MSQIFLELGRADPVQVDCGPSIELAHGYRHSPYQHAHGPRDRETLGLKIPSPLASTKPRAIQEVGGKLPVTDASGRIQTAFYDQGLATELEAFKTFVHELDHIEAFEAAGALSSEQAADRGKRHPGQRGDGSLLSVGGRPRGPVGAPLSSRLDPPGRGRAGRQDPRSESDAAFPTTGIRSWLSERARYPRPSRHTGGCRSGSSPRVGAGDRRP